MEEGYKLASVLSCVTLIPCTKGLARAKYQNTMMMDGLEFFQRPIKHTSFNRVFSNKKIIYLKIFPRLQMLKTRTRNMRNRLNLFNSSIDTFAVCSDTRNEMRNYIGEQQQWILYHFRRSILNSSVGLSSPISMPMRTENSMHKTSIPSRTLYCE